MTSKHRWFSGRMLACHAGGPGSIPGRCNYFLDIFLPLMNSGTIIEIEGLRHWGNWGIFCFFIESSCNHHVAFKCHYFLCIKNIKLWFESDFIFTSSYTYCLLIAAFCQFLSPSDVGIVVSIAAFQAVDPGSIPGHRISYSQFIDHAKCKVEQTLQ